MRYPAIGALAPLALRAGRALPYIGWATTIGLGIYELQNVLLGNQVEATKNAANVEGLLREQQRRFDQELAAERNRQNARDVAAAYVRGLAESAAKLPPAPPPPTAQAGTAITAASIVPLPPTTLRGKLGAAATKFMATPLFLPLLTGAIAAITASRNATSAPLEELPPEEFPLTDFQEGPVEFLGGQLGGAKPEELAELEQDVAEEPCEEIDPKRTPGECRQGWFSETPTKLFLQEWSRRPCQ